MSEPGTIRQDQEHLRLLAIFHFLCAGLVGTILGVFTIIVLIRPNVKALFKQSAPA